MTSCLLINDLCFPISSFQKRSDYYGTNRLHTTRHRWRTPVLMAPVVIGLVSATNVVVGIAMAVSAGSVLMVVIWPSVQKSYDT
jgi:hypothetical protein